jgi:hypothetical protein
MKQIDCFISPKSPYYYVVNVILTNTKMDLYFLYATKMSASII